MVTVRRGYVIKSSVVEPEGRSDVRFRAASKRPGEHHWYSSSIAGILLKTTGDEEGVITTKERTAFYSLCMRAIEYRFFDNVPPEHFEDVLKAAILMHEYSIFNSGDASVHDSADPDCPGEVAGLAAEPSYTDFLDLENVLEVIAEALKPSVKPEEAYREFEEAFKALKAYEPKVLRNYNIDSPPSQEYFRLGERFRREAGIKHE